MKYFSLLFALLFMASCHSKQKPSESQREAQDSIQVEQPEFPPLEAGVVEYQDDEAFGEVIELEGRQFVPDSFIFRPRNAKVVVKGKYLVMRVDVFSQDLHPFIIFDYPEMTYVTEVGKYGNGPDEFIFGDIIPTTDPDCLCYLMEITRDKLYKLTRKGEIVPYPYSFRSSAYQENFKEYIHNIGKDDFIYTDSFHGIAFSLKFQKPFVAYYAESSRATRLVDLRDRLNLKKQIISSVSDAKEKEAIESELDYVYINERLKEMKEESIRFLRSNLLPCLVYRNEDFD